MRCVQHTPGWRFHIRSIFCVWMFNYNMVSFVKYINMYVDMFSLVSMTSSEDTFS